MCTALLCTSNTTTNSNCMTHLDFTRSREKWQKKRSPLHKIPHLLMMMVTDSLTFWTLGAEQTFCRKANTWQADSYKCSDAEPKTELISWNCSVDKARPEEKYIRGGNSFSLEARLKKIVIVLPVSTTFNLKIKGLSFNGEACLNLFAEWFFWRQ